jgi:hypothetical protein
MTAPISIRLDNNLRTTLEPEAEKCCIGLATYFLQLAAEPNTFHTITPDGGDASPRLSRGPVGARATVTTRSGRARRQTRMRSSPATFVHWARCLRRWAAPNATMPTPRSAMDAGSGPKSDPAAQTYDASEDSAGARTPDRFYARR